MLCVPAEHVVTALFTAIYAETDLRYSRDYLLYGASTIAFDLGYLSTHDIHHQEWRIVIRLLNRSPQRLNVYPLASLLRYHCPSDYHALFLPFLPLAESHHLLGC